MRHATAAVNGGVNETYSLRFRRAHARRRATRYADCARGRGSAADLVVGTDLGRGDLLRNPGQGRGGERRARCGYSRRGRLLTERPPDSAPLRPTSVRPRGRTPAG